MWDSKHARGEHDELTHEPNEFAKYVVEKEVLTPGMNVLELGCGVSADAAYFAKQGMRVLATDFSSEAISKQSAVDGVEYKVLDIETELPSLQAAPFDAVYAHLSLHYYPDKQTRQIFYEITRILQPGGALVFSCKSTKDPNYGHGEKIEPNFFVKDGHVRHLFSPDYVRDLLSGQFTLLELREVEGDYNNKQSAFITCIARRM